MPFRLHIEKADITPNAFTDPSANRGKALGSSQDDDLCCRYGNTAFQSPIYAQFWLTPASGYSVRTEWQRG